MIIPQPHQNLMKSGKEEVRIEDIMSLCHKNFRNILPNKINYNYDSKTILFPFEKNQIIELINQIDVCIQLLIQVLFFLLLFFPKKTFCAEFIIMSEPRYSSQNL